MKSILINSKTVVCILFSLFLIASSQQIKAQDNVRYIVDEPMVSTYIGLGTGLNASTGFIGAALDIPITRQFHVLGAGGIGTWGYKLGAGLSYNLKKSLYGSAISILYSNAFGLSDFETSLETDSGAKEVVTLDLNNAANLNLIYNYQWKSGKKNKIVLGAGYSIKLTTDAWEVVSNHTLSSTSEAAMNYLQPGGVIVSFAYLFGL